MLTPDPMLTSKYGKMLGSAVWNLYSGFPCRWYINASSEMFFSRKLQPLMRQLISSSLSTLLKWRNQLYDQHTREYIRSANIHKLPHSSKCKYLILLYITLQAISIITYKKKLLDFQILATAHHQPPLHMHAHTKVRSTWNVWFIKMNITLSVYWALSRIVNSNKGQYSCLSLHTTVLLFYITTHTNVQKDNFGPKYSR